jgi:hypothetical protein
MEIREATAEEEKQFFGKNDPAVSGLHCAVHAGTIVGMSGLYRDYNYQGSIFEEDGRQIAFLSVTPEAPRLGWPAVIAMRRFLEKQTGTVIVQQDDAYPQSEKLLAVLGFTKTPKVMPDFRGTNRKLRVWQWQRSPQSQ